MIAAIVAISENNVMGIDNKLPWHLPGELAYFKKITTGNTIVMGRKTYDSIGRPLPNRQNVVVTRQKDFMAEGVTVINDLEAYLKNITDENVFIIGGAEIFKIAFPYFDALYITEVLHNFEGDTWFPDFNKNEWKLKSESEIQTDEKSKINYKYLVYVK